MSKRETHLGAARKHGRVALRELRRMTADSTLYWVLSHRTRVAQFRRTIKGTRAEKALDQLIARIRTEATRLPRRAPKRKARRTRRHRRTTPMRYLAQPFLIG